ncbi:MAG: thiamine pyrophosphate-dependent dehydrogenase E1 component subunit alpha [Acidobacteriia bacterium]|nr:thiamine pyrophosphate-dependent dehydrogenase E1 component subunit alpha [Terriglobia bacterium]
MDRQRVRTGTDETQAATPAALLETMMLIRAYELKLPEIGIKMVCTSVGQEASAAGVVHALAAEDLILTNHRSAGHLIARGADPGRMLAEVMGKSTGYCKGKSGTLHISVKDLGIVLTSTIVGGELSLAPGVALSQQQLERPGIVACFFGDGAATEGVFHESLNLAAKWNLPILYICENNQWQAYVHRRETMLTDHISTWAAKYGIESLTVDGNDVTAVHAAARVAADKVRTARKPFFLETYTFRMHGHMEADDLSYVDREELAAWAAKDPIQRQTERIVREGLLSAEDVAQMETRVRSTIESAVAFAGSSPYPELSELTTEIYA